MTEPIAPPPARSPGRPSGGLLTSVVGSHARPSWFVSGIDGRRARRVRPGRPRGDARRRGRPRAARPGGGRHRRRQRRRDAPGRLLHGRVLPAPDRRPGAARRTGGSAPAATTSSTASRSSSRSRRPTGSASSPNTATRPRTRRAPLKVTLPGPYTLSGRLTYGPGQVYARAQRRRRGVRPDPARRARGPGRRPAPTFIQIDEPSPAIHPGRAGRLRGAVQRGGRAGRRAGAARRAPVLRELPRPAAGPPDLPAGPRRDARLPGRRAGPRVRQPRDGRGRDPRRDRRRRTRRRGGHRRRQELLPRDRRRRRRADRRGARGRRPARAADARPGLRLQPDARGPRHAPSSGPWSPDATSCSDGTDGGRRRMNGHAITMLGTGLIGDFYTNTLHGQRGRDRVRVVYSRSAERGDGVPASAGTSPSPRPTWPPRSTIPTRTSWSSALPNFLHEEAVGLVAKAGKAVLCTKPLGRTAEEARRMLETVEEAGVFGGYLEDLCYTPKTLKAIASVRGRRDRRRDLGPLARDASRAAQRLVLGRPADRRRRDHRPRLPLHRDHPQLRRQGEPAGRGAVPHGHARPPDRRRGQRGRAHPVRVGRDRPVRGELDVPRRHGPARRGGRHARHDLAQPLPADRVRDVHAPAAAGGYVAEKAETLGGLAVPGRRRGRPSSATSTCSATCSDAIDDGPGAAGDVLRRLRRQRDHGRRLPLGEGARLGAGRARRGAAATTPRIASTPETLRGPGRHQARDPARRPPQADPQGPGVGRLHATGSSPGPDPSRSDRRRESDDVP